jgi:hypothetical protein
MEATRLGILLDAGTLLYRSTCLNFMFCTNTCLNLSDEPPQSAGIPSKPGVVQPSTSQTSESSGSTVWKAITEKREELNPTVQNLPTAKPGLYGGTRRKHKKVRAGQSDTGSVTQSGHKTIPPLSTSPKRHRSGGDISSEQPPKKSRTSRKPY